MKVADLKRLRRLAVSMRYAPCAENLEWHARAIAKVVAEIDAGERIATFPVRSPLTVTAIERSVDDWVPEIARPERAAREGRRAWRTGGRRGARGIARWAPLPLAAHGYAVG